MPLQDSIITTHNDPQFAVTTACVLTTEQGEVPLDAGTPLTIRKDNSDNVYLGDSGTILKISIDKRITLSEFLSCIAAVTFSQEAEPESGNPYLQVHIVDSAPDIVASRISLMSMTPDKILQVTKVRRLIGEDT